MLKAIFFDIDNTLLDFMTAKVRCIEAAVDSMIGAGMKMNKEDAIKGLFELYDIHGIEEQHIFEKFLKKQHGKINYRIVAHGIYAYRKAREHYLKPYPNVIKTLLALKSEYLLGVITDAPMIQAWMRLVSLKMDDFFDIVITAGDVRKQKTHVAPFKAALKAAGVNSNEALMIGDRIERDIHMAKKAGMYTAYARYGERRLGKEPAPIGQSGADIELEDIIELLEKVKKL